MVFESKKSKCHQNFTHIKPNDTYEQSFCAFFDSVFTDPEISIPRANKICVQVRAAILMFGDTLRQKIWVQVDVSFGDGRGKGNFVRFG